MLLLLLWLLLSPTDAQAAWRPPVDGPVVGTFTWSPARPYAAGRRRGVLLRTWRGERVHAACSGRVTFAGPTPRGRVVSVRCGALTATHLPLEALDARRGAAVARGGVIGTAATAALHVGARKGSVYVDPEPLLAAAADAPPLGPAPLPGRTLRRRDHPGSPPPRAGVPAARVPDARLPLPAVLAVGALAAATGAGGLVHRRRRGHRVAAAPRTAASSLSRRP